MCNRVRGSEGLKTGWDVCVCARQLYCSSVSVECLGFFFFQAEDGIRALVRSRGLGDVYKRQPSDREGRSGDSPHL